MGESIDVMHQQDIDAIKPEALKTRLERPHHAVVAIVIDIFQVRHAEKNTGVGLAGLARLDQAADLGRYQKFAARLAAQNASDAMLRKAKAVKRRGIEIAQTLVPRPRHGAVAMRLGIDMPKIAQSRGAEAECGEGQRLAAPCDEVAARRHHASTFRANNALLCS